MKGQKGITLIALIITIIVMLILVGVSITVVIQSGLLETAETSTNKWEKHSYNESVMTEQINVNNKLVNISSYGN